MPRRLTIALFLACGLASGPSWAEPPGRVTLAYDAYAAGLPVARMDVVLDLAPGGYAMALRYHTTGLVGAIVSSRQDSSVSGRWRGDVPVPALFRADGEAGGDPRHVLIDYPASGPPQVRTLVPPNGGEREAVPPDLTTDTEDTLSAFVQIVRVATDTGRCDGTARLYDGRRLTDVTVRTGGTEALPRTGRSAFAGDALRCDVTGRLVAGFSRNAGAAARQAKQGAAWLARLAPGGPMLPVRILFPTPWVGSVTLYLASVSADAKP